MLTATIGMLLPLAEREFVLRVGHLIPVKRSELSMEQAAALLDLRFLVVAALCDDNQAE